MVGEQEKTTPKSPSGDFLKLTHAYLVKRFGALYVTPKCIKMLREVGRHRTLQSRRYVTLLTRIQEGPDSYLGPAILTKVFRGFQQSRHANVARVPQIQQ